MTVIEPDDFARRVIEPHAFIADTEAFVDVRIERSRGKASYSFIGPGVSQNADQKINLTVPHGFNVGGASMPSGVVNNAHLHYTAEVFVCTRGSYRMSIGRHGEQVVDIAEGDVFAAPTWVFRGFSNTGPDDSWVFVVLGGDDTGGIIWSPDVLREAADTGLHLGLDNAVIEAADADPNEGTVVTPLSDDELDAIDSYTDEELEAHAVRADARDWSDTALLSATLPGHRTEVAPVLGHGMSEDRRHRPAIVTAPGFSIEWLRIAPGCSTGMHRLNEPQVLLIHEGRMQIANNLDDDRLEATPAAGSVVSQAPGVWRDIVNNGDEPLVIAVICGTDSPNRIEWHPDIVARARAAGWVRDAAGKVAALHLLPRGSAFA